MKNSLKNLFIRTIEKIHLWIFGNEMSGQMREFLSNLSWSFCAAFVSMPVFIIIGTLAGRFMGPTEYGKYNLVILISSYAVTFAFLGLDISTIKRISKAKTEQEKRVSFFSTFVFVMSMLVFLSIIGLIISPIIVSKTGISLPLIALVIIFTFITSLKSILDILVRALERFKLQTRGRILEISVIIAGFVLVLVLFNKINYQLYLGIIILGMIVLIIYYLNNLKIYFHNFSLKVLKSQLLEGKLFMFSTILGTIFFSSDRLLIAKYLDVTALGIYSAYYTASLGLVASLALILTNVLLPAASKTNDKKFTIKLDQLMIKGFFPIYLLICLAIFIFLKVLGGAYPFNLGYLFLFAFVACLYLYQIIYGLVILDAERRDYIKYLLISTLTSTITVAYYFVLMKYLSKSIALLLVGFSINLIVNLIILRFFVRQMREQSQGGSFVKRALVSYNQNTPVPSK